MGKHVGRSEAVTRPSPIQPPQSDLREKSLKVSRSVMKRNGPLQQEKITDKPHSYSLDIPSHITQIKGIIGKVLHRS